MRVLVCGGRDYDNRHEMRSTFRELSVFASERPTLVHGNARGADRMAEELWNEVGLPVDPHPADWERYGKRAGVVRNQEMLDSGIDLLIAFPGGKGTADMVRRARAAGIEIHEVSAPGAPRRVGKP